MSNFALDNNCEFYPSLCFVKDQQSKEILLQGSIKQGIYVFDLSVLSSKSKPKFQGPTLAAVKSGDDFRSSELDMCCFLSCNANSVDKFSLWH